MGARAENPKLGAGGVVVPLSSPKAIATGLEKLLTDKEFYRQCSETIKERVLRYYNKDDQHESYADLYRDLNIEAKDQRPAIVNQKSVGCKEYARYRHWLALRKLLSAG